MSRSRVRSRRLISHGLEVDFRLVRAARLRADNSGNLIQSVFEPILLVEHNVVEAGCRGKLPRGGRKPGHQLCRIVGLAMLEPLQQRRRRLGRQEDGHRAGYDALDLGSALYVDFDEDILAPCQRRPHGSFQNPVKIAVDGSRLEKLPLRKPLSEITLIQKKVVNAVNLTRAPFPGRGRDCKESLGESLPELFDDGILANPRWPGDDKNSRATERPQVTDQVVGVLAKMIACDGFHARDL